MTWSTDQAQAHKTGRKLVLLLACFLAPRAAAASSLPCLQLTLTKMDSRNRSDQRACRVDLATNHHPKSPTLGGGKTVCEKKACPILENERDVGKKKRPPRKIQRDATHTHLK
ncbi:hypothetical protein MAPG_03138 [Magnaporthiopsis poae ATCC 64411]|uniref:Secreted protein n=1 Tax=Magnaporthiopsis poae (strain ATCC 64411 / 73-15) TaxID=644358 RepID=A0A0C4DT79_MAGP6|nr:hypothetical protein MAPG_03138 [Magnaporthiopsis poae ATCC 64411]